MTGSPRRSVLITGASSGIGAAMVRAFAADGWTVLATARRTDAIPDVAGAVVRLALDVTDRRQRAEVARVVDRRLGGRLDCLINNAGQGSVAPLEQLTEATLRAQFEVNFFGAALLTRDLLPALRAARGRVIAVASMISYTALPLHGAYGASKQALEGLCEALSYELAPHGVQVAILQPGAFRTRFGGRLTIEGDREEGPYAGVLRGFLALRDRLLQRPGADPAAVARAALRLAHLRRMPLKLRVGWDARALWALHRMLPEPLYRRVLARFIRHAFQPQDRSEPHARNDGVTRPSPLP